MNWKEFLLKWKWAVVGTVISYIVSYILIYLIYGIFFKEQGFIDFRPGFFMLFLIPILGSIISTCLNKDIGNLNQFLVDGLRVGFLVFIPYAIIIITHISHQFYVPDADTVLAFFAMVTLTLVWLGMSIGGGIIGGLAVYTIKKIKKK